MKSHSSIPCFFSIIHIFLLLIPSLTILTRTEFFRFAEAGKRKIHITDDLDDVIDDEEDESWKEWGKKLKSSSGIDDMPPPDFSKMEMSEIQAEIMKRQLGPAMGFVKLRLGVQRTRDTVAEIAMKWTKVLRTGAIEIKFMGVDLSTIMFTMERGQNREELKEFVLNQPEAYEIKIGDQVFRRPGDPPLEEVVEMLKRHKNKADDSGPLENNKHLEKEEL